jgi:hypothetical protein
MIVDEAGRAGGLLRAARQILTTLVFGVLPVACVLLFVGGTIGSRTSLFDFHGDLYGAGAAILHGHNPYRAGFLAHLAALAHAGDHRSTTFAVPVYPAPALLLSAPLALLPYTVAAVVFTALGIGALLLGLRLLGVRDPRCYGAAFLSWPVLHSLRLGQVNELLVLGLAIVWRYRDRAAMPALAAAATISAKLLLWPVALFLVFERRFRTAVIAAAAAALGTAAAWAAIGFAGLAGYPRMLGDLARVEGAAGVSFGSLSVALGGSRALGDDMGLAITAGLIALAWRLARRDALADGSARAFSIVVVGALTASPLVWPHYLTLLLVPIALISPAFGPLWLVPLLAWAAPVELTDGRIGTILVYIAIESIVVLSAASPLIGSLGRRYPGPSRAFRQPLGGGGATVRLAPGLESTTSRSYLAAQRPNKGPEEPYYTQVEDLVPRTANRPT